MVNDGTELNTYNVVQIKDIILKKASCVYARNNVGID